MTAKTPLNAEIIIPNPLPECFELLTHPAVASHPDDDPGGPWNDPAFNVVHHALIKALNDYIDAFPAEEVARAMKAHNAGLTAPARDPVTVRIERAGGRIRL